MLVMFANVLWSTFVDATLTALKDPDSFHKESQSNPWNHKLKNVEEPKCHFGGDFFGDKDRTLCHGVQTYVKRLVETYKELFSEQLKEVHHWTKTTNQS